MRRGEAGRAVKDCAYLTAAEKVVFLSLLEGADNGNCSVPPFTTPTMKDLADWTSLHRATVYRAVEHLERHGWLSHEAGGGRGRRSKYCLVPRVPDTACGCERVARRDPLGGNGRTERHKGSHETTQRVALLTPSSQVEPAFVRREAGTGGGISLPVEPGSSQLSVETRKFSPTDSTALKRCDRCESTATQIIGMYRLCREHAGQQWKETA